MARSGDWSMGRPEYSAAVKRSSLCRTAAPDNLERASRKAAELAKKTLMPGLAGFAAWREDSVGPLCRFGVFGAFGGEIHRCVVGSSGRFFVRLRVFVPCGESTVSVF
jgi:hypothetical protein